MADGLQAAGYTLVATGTGPAATTAVATAFGHAILVADRQVEPQENGPNGFQIAAQALEHNSDLRVIYISGNHLALRRRSLGTRERILMKPFAMSQLLTLVRELGG